MKMLSTTFHLGAIDWHEEDDYLIERLLLF
jgi:hypothetical protein